MWTTCASLIVLFSLSYRIEAQTCQSASPYSQCSPNIACGCLPLTDTDNGGICAYLYLTCTEFVSCTVNNRTCYQPGYVCVKHPRCLSHPVCYPLNMASSSMCPSILPVTTTATPPRPSDGICASATWDQNGITVAGGNGLGPALNQLNHPSGLWVDHDAAVYIADGENQRIVKWAPGASSGQVVAGGNVISMLGEVISVVVDKNETMFICDFGNSRVQRWFKSDNQGQTIIKDISCFGLALDNEGSLYITDSDHHRVTKWPGGQIVAGGNGDGGALNQLSSPQHLFVDQDQSVFVPDYANDRVVKWLVGAKEGIVVAGGNGKGNAANQLDAPTSVVVDQMDTVYVADFDNHRIMRWFKDTHFGNVIIGGQEPGNGTFQLSGPFDLAFDRNGNLYVTDLNNNRVQMFAIDKSSCTGVSIEKQA